MNTTGQVSGIISNLVTVDINGPVGQNEICYITLGEIKMMAEVIKVIGNKAYVQVFDSTQGLKIGDKVEFQGHMLEATLGPGILSKSYDGLQNDLEKMPSLFIERGTHTEPLDFDVKWEFKPLAKAGDKVRAGDWLGSVKEKWVDHKIMVPFTFAGEYTVKSVTEAGEYTVNETMAVLVDSEGAEHNVTMVQKWPVKKSITGRHQLLRLRKAHLLAALNVVVFGVPLEFAGADPHECQTVPMRLVHVGLDLKDEGGEIGVEGVHSSLVGNPGQGRGSQLQEGFQEGLDAEVGQRGAEEHRGELTSADGIHVHFAAGGEQLHIVDELLGLGFAVQKFGYLGIVQVNLLLAGLRLAADTGEEQKLTVFPVIHALEVLAGTDRPVHGVSFNAQLPFHFVQQVEGIFGLPVHLVDEGEDGDVTHGTDFEKFSGLGFDALGSVDNHDGRVSSHQRTVGVFREVLVTRRIQNVDAVAFILELHDGRGDGDTTLLFNLHPVRGGSTGVLLAFDNAGLGDGAAVEQELFG